MAEIYSLEGVRPVIHDSSFVHPSAVIIGDVVIGPECWIGPGASLRGDLGRLTLGQGVNVQDNCVMHCFPGASATIEDWGHIGIGAVIHGCVIGQNSMIGMNSVIMDGSRIGPRSIVAAMSFVKAGTETPDQSLIAGVPAKVMRPLSDDEVAWKEKGTQEYHKIVARMLASLRPCEPLTTIDDDRPVLQVEPHQPLHIAKKTMGKDSGASD